MFAVASSWNRYSLPVRLAGSPVHRSFASTPNVTPRARRIANSERSDLLEVGVVRARAAEPHQVLVARRVERLEAGRRHELLAHVRGQPPDVAAPLQVVVHRAQRVGRLAVRHQAAPRADDERQVLDAHRALVLARAARRALPQHAGVVLLGELRVHPARRAAPPRSAGSASSGSARFPVAYAGQFIWHRPHSTHVNASSTCFFSSCATVSRPTSSFSKSRFLTSPSIGDFRKTVTGDSTRWKCFEFGISARKTRMMTACSHQLTVAASPSSRRNTSRRNVIISVAMNTPMSTDSHDSGPSASGRTATRRMTRTGDPDEHADRERHERQRVPTGTRRCA